ncbi:MAG TPA: 50S ribosomal protein L4 [Aggregatilineales bacterium]|nr:50S ribosomal protein L4 [Anaerolineales bacterium]HRE48390.1 50S ribosomal protein L4 [Aggregatilineales bacterium]
MKVPVLNMAGKEVGSTELPADIFEAKINIGLMHQYVVMQNANARLGTHKTKRRGEINRTHAKWYRQKGTGRARHGSRSAPLFVGGGRAHGPIPHKYTLDMPRKMRHTALRSALSALLRDGQIIVVDSITVDEPKTKLMANILKALVGDQSSLLLLAGRDDIVERCVRNLDDAAYLRASYMNVRDLLQYDRLIIPLNALDVIKGLLSRQRVQE